MPTKVNSDKVKSDADTIAGVWKVNTDFKLKDVTLESFEADTKRLDANLRNISANEQELTPLRNERDDLTLKLNEVCTRARSGMKGVTVHAFGCESSLMGAAGQLKMSWLG